MSLIAASLLVSQSAVAAVPPSPPTCESAEFRAFDFWLGEWDVSSAGSDKVSAHSRIEKVSSGCAIRESWMPLKGQAGSSLTGRDPATGRWHQTWFGGAGGATFFDGGMVGETMVLTGWWAKSGPKGEDGLTRMTYSRNADGSVRQHGEFSADHGVSWATSFDLIYRPRKSGP